MRRRILLLVTILCVAVLGVACTSEESKSSETTEPLAVASTVHISDGRFDPRTVEIQVGGTVMWINDDVATHQLESVVPGVIHSGRIRAGASYTRTFSGPGEYQYYCSIYNTMKGTIIVR